jgi:AraC-like DNA-binding protein
MVAPKLAKGSELWLKPSTEISVAEIAKEVGLSARTLYKAFGPRVKARDAKERGKPHA